MYRHHFEVKVTSLKSRVRVYAPKSTFRQKKLLQLIKQFMFMPAGIHNTLLSKIVSEYDQEIPQSQTAHNTVAPRGRAAQPSRDTRKTN